MKALINPQQQNLVVQVEPDISIFQVAQPLYWVDCLENIKAYEYIYENGTFNLYVPEILQATSEQNKQKASQLLLETDWINQPDVEPLLINKQQFLDYRTIIRQYVIVPQAGNILWPQKPQAQWSQQ